MEKKYNIAVIGATASNDSIGTDIQFGNLTLKVSTLDNFNFSKIDIAFFAAGSKISREHIPQATSKGCIVIDKSSFFRFDKDVPLIVPEANLSDIKNYNIKNIIASPNCCTIPIVTTLKPLDNEAIIKRIVASTYQSVSGAGKLAMDELYNQTKAKYIFDDLPPKIFPKQIAFNLFPHIGDFNQDGSTTEEFKISLELEKIINPYVKSNITCVRVPVFISHAISLNVEFKKQINAKEAEKILKESDSIKLHSISDKLQYSSPIDVAGDDFVHVSRIRNDKSQKNTLSLWITSDNLRKGAALNAVQIAEELVKQYL
ncbi:unnamed protein product [Oppiella nova]|uniref:aspartate-semialdehyde dehydrogenase n=1 Tax=Oppiella nova TaxID=334625 RepID=A0A7R9L9N4_9ACAR|nr:unnamed protein product [Oppiella nova]CAG2161099.1 unnamed protein product [Oppiella nova]